MTTALLLFVSTYVLVFALGLQSLNVNGGHYLAAFLTSFVIGAANMVLLKLGPEAAPFEIGAYLAGGPLGIVTAMWFHRRTIGRARARSRIPSPGGTYDPFEPEKEAQRLYPYPPTPQPTVTKTEASIAPRPFGYPPDCGSH